MDLKSVLKQKFDKCLIKKQFKYSRPEQSIN